MDKPQKPGSTHGTTGAVRTIPWRRPSTSATTSSTANRDHHSFTAFSSSENPYPPTPQPSISSKSSKEARPSTPSSSQSRAGDPASYRAGLEDDRSNLGPSSTEFYPQSDSDNPEDDAVPSGNLKRSTTSVRSHTAKFTRSLLQKFGRSYSKRYDLFPNDKQEKERNVLQHEIFLEVFEGRLHLAPVVNPQSVLDLGTGPGNWALEYAKRNPKTEVLGVDIDPVRPSFTLPNCCFQVHDFTKWHPDQKFDFIHMRMIGGLPSKEVFKSIYDSLNPGGWAEFTEWIVILQSSDHSLEGSSILKWNRLLCQALEKLGISDLYPLEYKPRLQEQGFQEVHERKYAVPINTWPPGKKIKKVGAMMTSNFLTVIDALSAPLMTGTLGWSHRRLESLLNEVRKEVSDTRIHSFVTLMTVFGQKPEEKTSSAPSVQSSSTSSLQPPAV
ncbi:S-adenosyl-L-methionine-dependent methyltransferase [Xylariaceae sp. FL0662B]|nr:S-adenosyl-L-methionine-dependent methyltransferase [Xylariaceae sp. FL0662B]